VVQSTWQLFELAYVGPLKVMDEARLELSIELRESKFHY